MLNLNNITNVHKMKSKPTQDSNITRTHSCAQQYYCAQLSDPTQHKALQIINNLALRTNITAHRCCLLEKSIH